MNPLWIPLFDPWFTFALFPLSLFYFYSFIRLCMYICMYTLCQYVDQYVIHIAK